MRFKSINSSSILGCLVATIVLYLGLAPKVAWPLYNAILFQPTHATDDESEWERLEKEFSVKRTEVSITEPDHTIIEAWFIKLPAAKRVFLVSQGRGGSFYRRAGMARMLLRSGGSVLLYNYRGYGKSTGSPSLEGVCLDAVSAYDYLVTQQNYPGSSIIAYGESFGSGVTGQLALRRRVGGVVLQSGFSSLLRASKDTLPWLRIYPRFCFPAQMMDNIDVFKRTHPPLLIVHGEKDRVLRCDNARDLFARASAPKSIVYLPEGTHGSFGKGNEYFVALQSFLSTNNL